MTSEVSRVARYMHPLSSRQKWFAMAIAYFDESGHQSNCDVIAFAGLVAPEKKWEVYEQKWKGRLRRAGIDPKESSFHANKFHTGNKPFHEDKWKDVIYRNCFFSDLVSYIDTTVTFASVHAVIVKDWAKVLSPILTDYESQQRACYVYLMLECLGSIIEWAKLPRGETIACIFDRKPEVEYFARTMFYDLKDRHDDTPKLFEGADWKDRQNFVPLQAADLVAYEGFQTAMDIHVRGKEELRPQSQRLFNNLEDGKRVAVKWHTEADLQAFVNQQEAR